ncbi:MAG TPA: sigma-70 family RNA polymerase sigma factor [Candidatus Saccharimonadales bacterium]|nr:sigma-70 family RNA polymerase sigma factor [Candidatus Saccharimonadales bacterium]
MQQKDEAELIAQSLSGDSVSYGELVDRYKNAIYHHCFAILRSEDAAEDMAQETFIAAYYKLKSYKTDYKFSTWLFKISTNKCLDLLRRRKYEVLADNEVFATIAAKQPGPEKLAQYDELHRAVHKLKPRYKAAISLHYWQGLGYEEIALALSAPVGSVKGWINRAKRELKKELS